MPWHPCVNSRDTITTDEGLVIPNSFQVPDDNNFRTVKSACRTSDGTWIAWMTDFTILGTGSSFNPMDTYNGNDFPVSVGYFPDDGSSATVYDLALNYVWRWDDSSVYGDGSLCGRFGPVFGAKYWNNTKSELVGWNLNAIDIQVRTDGTNVWVAVLAGESVLYPYLFGYFDRDRCGAPHPSITDVAPTEGLSPGEDGNAFLHDTSEGNRWWTHYGGNDSVNDDPGDHNSWRWQPARVTVFGGDLGGFTKLGTVEANFDNLSSNPNVGIGLNSGLEAAASAAEPGLHVVWAEAGGWDTYRTKIGQRITYSTWDGGSKLGETNLAGATEALVAGNGLNSADNWVWTAEMILRNDHGSAALIILPWEITSEDEFGIHGAPGAPEYWDISGGSAVVVQTMDTDLFPTEAETGLLAQIAPTGGLLNPSGPSYTSSEFHRRHYASSLYTDPTDADIDVYLLGIGFYSQATSSEPGGNLTGNQSVAFYRIPVDGSAPFDYMDGTRLPMYSILPKDTFAEDVADFVSDPGNVWVPTHFGEVLHLPRTCTRTWEVLDGFTVVAAWVDAFGVASFTSPPTIVTDDAGEDWLAGGGALTDPPISVAALRAKICRCCVPCIERIGLHIWEKV